MDLLRHFIFVCSETGLNEPLCWKEHDPPAECSEDGSTKTCYIITNHFSLYCLVSEVEDATESADETSTNTESADETSTNTESADETSAHTDSADETSSAIDSAEETEGDVTLIPPENEIATKVSIVSFCFVVGKVYASILLGTLMTC